MSAKLEKRDQAAVKTTAAEQMAESGPAYSPDVDIYASDDGLYLLVDLPGVEKGDVQINIDEDNTLTVRARNSETEPGEALIRQFRVGNYYRAFRIGDEFDKEKVSGTLENGVLELRVPRREEAKPKRIEITA